MTAPGVLVDVGITTGGRATYLREAVGSALGQTLREIRVTVGENGPGVPEVAEALEPFRHDPRFRHLIHGVDLGPAGNYSTVARGEAPYVAILHDDDRWDPGFLERRVEFLEKHPECGFVFSRVFMIDEEGSFLDVSDVPLQPGVYGSDAFLRATYDHNIVPVPSVLMRRSAYEAVGGEFADLLLNDYEIWLRIGSSFPVGVLAEIDAAYRVHANQTTSANARRINEHHLKLYDAVAGDTGDKLDRSLLDDARARVLVFAASDSLDRGDRREALRMLAHAARVSPAMFLRRRALLRAGLVTLAAVPGQPAHRIWIERRRFGRLRSNAYAARKVGIAMRGRPGPDDPLFSVVVPARDAARTLGEALDSVLLQSCQDFELIVVDDGSEDDTAAVAEAHAGPRVTVIRNERSRGPSASRNAAIAVARGRYVSFLDADDLWLPTYLAQMRRALSAEPPPALAFTDAWAFDEAARRFRRLPLMARRRPDDRLLATPESIFAELLRDNFVFVGTTVTMEALRAVGGFDESLKGVEDYDLWLRIVRAGHRVVYVGGRPLAVYRQRADGTSLSSDAVGMGRGHAEVLRRLLAGGGLGPEQEAVVRARLDEVTAEVARRERDAVEGRALRARVRGRLRRLVRQGKVYGPTPPEILGAFPELVGARPLTSGSWSALWLE